MTVARSIPDVYSQARRHSLHMAIAGPARAADPHDALAALSLTIAEIIVARVPEDGRKKAMRQAENAVKTYVRQIAAKQRLPSGEMQ